MTTNKTDGSSILNSITSQEELDEEPSSHLHDDDDDDSSASNSRKQETLRAKAIALYFWFACIDQEEDTFEQILRKSSVTILAPLSPLVLTYAGYMGFISFFHESRHERRDDMLAVKIQGVHLIFFFLTLLIPYIVLRFKRHISAIFMDVVVSLVIFHTAVTAITVPQYGSKDVAICTAVYAVLAQTNYVALEVFLSAALFLLHSFNSAYIDEGVALVIPGYRHGPPLEVFLGYVSVFGIVFMLVLAVIAQSMEHNRQVSSANSAVDMSRHVVDLLRRYDTDGVSEALKKYVDNVDPHLVRSLQAMNENLETYKPHLPNYIFQEEEEDDDENVEHGSHSQIDVGGQNVDSDDDEEYDEGSLDFSPSLSSMSHNEALKTSQTSAAYPPAALTIRTSNLDTSGHHHGSDKGRTLKSTVNGIVAAAAMGRKDSNASSSKSFIGIGLTTALTMGAKSSVYEGKISYVMVECPVMTGSAGVGKAARFVEMIHQAAGVSKAAIHSVVGDVATLSWNATHRVQQPEMKAAKFLSHVMKIEQQEGLNEAFMGSQSLIPSTPFMAGKENHHASFIAPNSGAGAVAFTGVASCYSVTTSKKQHALLISAPWLPMAQAAFKIACAYGSKLINETTEMVASTHFECAVVDQIVSVPNRGIPLFDCMADSVGSSPRREQLDMSGSGRDHMAPFSGSSSIQQSSKFIRKENIARAIPLTDLRAISNHRSHFSHGQQQLQRQPSLVTSFSGNLNGSGSPRHAGSQRRKRRPFQRTLIFELIREVEHKEDEWMYQLEQKEKSGTTLATITSSAKEVFAAQLQALQGESDGTRTYVAASQGIKSFAAAHEALKVAALTNGTSEHQQAPHPSKPQAAPEHPDVPGALAQSNSSLAIGRNVDLLTRRPMIQRLKDHFSELEREPQQHAAE